MIPDPLIVDLNHVTETRPFAILFYGGSLPLWVGPSCNDQLSQIGSHRPSNLRKILYVIVGESERMLRVSRSKSIQLLALAHGLWVMSVKIGVLKSET